eukprot:983549-Amphidinium_carterae.3
MKRWRPRDMNFTITIEWEQQATIVIYAGSLGGSSRSSTVRTRKGQWGAGCSALASEQTATDSRDTRKHWPDSTECTERRMGMASHDHEVDEGFAGMPRSQLPELPTPTIGGVHGAGNPSSGEQHSVTAPLRSPIATEAVW